MEQKLKVLVVDDSVALLESLAAQLDGKYEVHKAECAFKAIQQAERCQMDMVFLDIILPDGDGYDLCKKLRKLYALRPLQVVLMSASDDSGRIQRVLEAGADDFIKKPFENLEFALRVKAATIRLAEQKKLVSEREFYRQAVHQEEQLSAKLLDKHMNLKEDLAAATEKRKAYDTEDKKLAASARYDVLSGLLSRQSLAARIELEARRATAEDQRMSGLMVDLDRFKQINDSYGNLAGDEVIRMVGDVIRSSLRREDFAGRYGGEEFFVILTEAELEVAEDIAQRLRSFIDRKSTRLNSSHRKRNRMPFSASKKQKHSSH